MPTPKAADCDLTLLKEEAELALIRKIADLLHIVRYVWTYARLRRPDTTVPAALA